MRPQNDDNPHTRTQPAHKMWHLYVLECEGNRLYTGITIDIERRLAAHKAGTGAKFTRSFPPTQLLMSLSFSDRTSAAKAEYDFKQLSAQAKRNFIAKQAARPDRQSKA